MKLSDFDYRLPEDRIAQFPAEPRDASRMLLLERNAQSWSDRQFRELPGLLRGGELLVVNNARVLPARLFGYRAGVKSEPAGRHSAVRGEYLSTPIEVLLTRELALGRWQGLVRPGRKIRVGERIRFGDGQLEAEVVARGEMGLRELQFEPTAQLHAVLERIGHVPLPPYIGRADQTADKERYQTIFARQSGTVAAPTAGLHFTPEIIQQLGEHGVEICEITLYVGLGTFQPIHSEEIEHHRMHSEAYEISEQAAERINAASRERRTVVAAGTTVVRALEDAAIKNAEIRPGRAEADVFIRPGFQFAVVSQLLTNFHLPKSSLLVMVSAFAGREFILRAYEHAIAQGYRFYSYGDCMLIR